MLCCLLLALFTQTFEGKVVGVTDGDTITILDANNQQKKCRLANIDAPETRGQAFGQAAKAHLSEKIFGKHVVIESSGLDGYKRYISTV